MPPKVMNFVELSQRVRDLSDLVVRLAQEANLAHLVDPEKFPELQGQSEGGQDAAPAPISTPVARSPGPRRGAPPVAPVISPGGSGGVLEFQYTGDRGGLVNFIATNQGTEAWTNPVDSGLIKVEASSIKKGRPADVVDAVFSNQVFYTDNIPYSWVCIDFGHYRIKPTFYSFAHRAGPPQLGFYMRNWELHASQDGETWVVVRKHANDASLHGTALVAAWQIEDNGLSFYRYFRTVIDPQGNSNSTSALVISCFEIYGEWEFDINAQ